MLKSISFYKYPVIKLFWWRLENCKYGNFGDEITKYIIEKNFNLRVKWASPDKCDLVGIGSIIPIITKNTGNNKPFIWGSGYLEAGKETMLYEDYKIVGVRGKLSLKRIKNIPKNIKITLGDPGLLADTLIRAKKKKEYKLGIIPHYVDIDSPVIDYLKQENGVLIINPLAPCLEVINNISKCEMIASSSLHGLIVSDSLHIPNYHIKISKNVRGNLYKFKDYYSVFQDKRYNKPITYEVLKKGSSEIARYINAQYVQPKDINIIKENILSAFPFKT